MNETDGRYFHKKTLFRVTPKGPAMYEELVDEGDFFGNRYAILKFVDNTRCVSGREITKYFSRIDVSPYERDTYDYIRDFICNNTMNFTNRNARVFEWSGSEFLANNCGIFLGNVSPSYWNNGFGQCHYIQVKICEFSSLSDRLRFEVRYGGLFSNKNFTADIMERIGKFMSPVFEKLEKTTKTEPPEF